MILGIDPGNKKIKICGDYGVIDFPSDISEYRERKLKAEHLSKYDIEFEYKGRRGFAGTLAQAEGEFAGTIKGDTKAHEDTLLRVLLALHCYSEYESFEIVVGQPINRFTEEEKMKIKAMLLGNHIITINGKKRFFNINRVEVAAEEAAAFWAEPEGGIIRIIGVGAGTIGCATVRDKRYIDKDSFSLDFGADTVKTLDLEAMVRKIFSHTSSWGRNDKVKLVGGMAEEIFPYIQKYFPRVKNLSPVIKNERLHPVYANCVGFYELARNFYGK